VAVMCCKAHSFSLLSMSAAVLMLIAIVRHRFELLG